MFTVAALYHFAPLDDLPARRDALRAALAADGVRGTILLAAEGVNGTIAGTPAAIARALDTIRALPGCAGLEWKESHAAQMPFGRLKVRIKREIVTLGQPADPARRVGTHVPAADWNALITAPDVVVIDTRNDYEVAIGTFTGAVDPGTRSFGDFPGWWAANRERFHNKRIAMFCTGGIRCEKASSWLLDQGVDEVFHLHGGILKYLEDVPEADSLWQGECFVFDGRVAVGHGLRQGAVTLCRRCGRPEAACACAGAQNP
ncbi:rhodanese-related sulfurtransferase [Ruixingdingia sedimenti]|uniref:tRNA uridine(34) hydroxylase n=1 Tax=Ruixingdingia sedimenti TaxID=3073604 RepID=A0ABU1F8E4_9RHOB|nr:rhodanese-related sulfurtransferase [Xinfangfangia sp. LG-4]MDR5652734.1 rhodanese-related sulfurtransferase [Xinfangfangia sp. LG-4]